MPFQNEPAPTAPGIRSEASKRTVEAFFTSPAIFCSTGSVYHSRQVSFCGASAPPAASHSLSDFTLGEVLVDSLDFRGIAPHGVDVAGYQIGVAKLGIDARQVEEVDSPLPTCTPSGKKAVMKLPCLCSQHLGGCSNMGAGASPKKVVAIAS